MQPTLPFSESPPRRPWFVQIARLAWSIFCWVAAFGAILYVGVVLL